VSALDELCPACLLKQGAESETGAQSEPTQFQPPGVDEVARLFPQLEILAFIGKGGMGAVYKARQPALDRFVALKILPSQAAGGPGFAERFSREARALARLSHPNIVAVHDFGVAAGILSAVEPGVPPGGRGAVGPEREKSSDNYSGGKMPPSTASGTPAATGLPFFIMEYVDGLNLRQLERAGKLSPREALQIVPQICEALQFAQDEGIVHRDIKPENILSCGGNRTDYRYAISPITARRDRRCVHRKFDFRCASPNHCLPAHAAGRSPDPRHAARRLTVRAVQRY
jgi:serine/threonine protein kinase